MSPSLLIGFLAYRYSQQARIACLGWCSWFLFIYVAPEGVCYLALICKTMGFHGHRERKAKRKLNGVFRRSPHREKMAEAVPLGSMRCISSALFLSVIPGFFFLQFFLQTDSYWERAMISIVIYVRFLFLCVCLLSFQRLLVNGSLLIWRFFYYFSAKAGRDETNVHIVLLLCLLFCSCSVL